MVFSNWSRISPCDAAIEAGLRFGDKGTHTSLTIMLKELSELLSVLPLDAKREAFSTSIIDENLLGKQTASTRRATFQRMSELYGLDVSLPVFRVLRRLWDLDDRGRPILAILCALGRDPLLRATASTVISLSTGEELIRQKLLSDLKLSTEDRLNDSILDKVARNTGSSWTQSGHLEGRVRKTRLRVEVTVYSVAYALWLGSLFGIAGEELYTTPWMTVLDCHKQDLIDMTLHAKRLRLIDARIGGGVVEIDPRCIDLGAEVK
jgi:hypothetical protein